MFWNWSRTWIFLSILLGVIAAEFIPFLKVEGVSAVEHLAGLYYLGVGFLLHWLYTRH